MASYYFVVIILLICSIKVIMMLDVAPTKGDVASMIDSMDLNKDGSVDFYEFCVHMQHLRDQRSASDVEYFPRSFRT